MEQSDHKTAMQIMSVIQDLLGQVPGTMEEHQKRINSVQYVSARLITLDKLEKKQNESPESGRDQ